MDLILADEKRREVAFIDTFSRFDAELSADPTVESNSWQLDLPRAVWRQHRPEVGWHVYVPGTPYGGRVDFIKIDAESVTLQGATWEGALARKIAPFESLPAGFSKDATGAVQIDTTALSFLRGIVRDAGELAEVAEDGDTSGRIKGWYRYETSLSVLRRVLEANSLALGAGYDRAVKKLRLYAYSVHHHADSVKLTDDYGVSLELTDDGMAGFGAIVIFGSGEGLDRKIFRVYRTARGGVSLDKADAAATDREYLYDYNSVDSEAEALAAAKKKFAEIGRKRTTRVRIPPSLLELGLGDIVMTSDRELGLVTDAKIIKKILRLTPHTASLEYEAEDVIKEGGYEL